MYIALVDNRLVGALRLAPSSDTWLLRSMCIDEQWRHRGIGTYMLREIAPELRRKHCYCFPYSHLEHFYRMAGFERINVQQAPASIAEPFTRYRDRGRDIVLMAYRT